MKDFLLTLRSNAEWDTLTPIPAVGKCVCVGGALKSKQKYYITGYEIKRTRSLVDGK